MHFLTHNPDPASPKKRRENPQDTTEVAVGDAVISITAVGTTSEASTPVCDDSCENVVASTPVCDNSCENDVASTPVCVDSCENVVSAAPSSATWPVATMPHTETSSSQDNAATTTINHTPPPVEALSLQNSSCGEVVDKTKYRSLLRSNQRHRHTIKVLKKNIRELQNVSVK